MAAGLGFKDFVTGEVLTASDVDGYLMQGIWVFASAAARDAAVTSPQEGNFAYLKDTNTTTYYTGSAWTNLDTTGMVNPMTTTGDTIYSSSGSTPARLGIGSTGQVLTVAGGVPTWASPAGGGKVLQVVQATSTSGTTNTSTSTWVDTNLTVNITPSAATSKVWIVSNCFGGIYGNDNHIGGQFRLVRGSSTSLVVSEVRIQATKTGSEMRNTIPVNLVYLDSPSTTSSTTYKLQIKVNFGASGQVEAVSDSYLGSITAWEIGA
jgi:hypothetical protein